MVDDGAQDIYSVSTVFYDKAFNPIVDDVRPVEFVEIYLNNKFSWGVFNDGDALNDDTLAQDTYVFDVRSCVLHEMGHALLPDPHGKPDSVNKYYEKDENGTISVINPAVSNPILFDKAKQTITDVDAQKFCSVWAV